ncbi:MAG: 2-oxo acid dehydrogenase subunit E2 [Acidobacteria bacterium]|nr:2-oxo acid dehydrogenase subunit E2 [Acidobacteriota bacterium]
MAIEITVPRLGWSMEEGIFAAWLKDDGDPVQPGEPLFALESEKVTMEVDSLDNGLLHIPAGAPEVGAVVTVGQLLGYILQPGEPKPALALPSAPPDRHTPASPRARAAAKQLGVDIAAVTPRPGAARIIEADVVNAKPQPSRAAIAARMEDAFRAPHFYLHADANVEALVRIRNEHRPASYNDFLIKAIAVALTRHPRINAYWHNGAVVPRTTHHVALAAQIGSTLYTPVIQNPAEKSLAQIARERELAMQSPTATVAASATLSNLGPFGVDRFEAILNPPQSVIVAAGRIARRPVVENDQVVARLTLPISLSVDHRVADGIPAAAFLQTLIGILESPEATYNEWE